MKIVLFCTYDIWSKEHLWIASELHKQLSKNHEVDINYVPFRNLPIHFNKQVFAYRGFSFSSADVVITMGPFAHVVRHKHKIVIMTNHLNNFYELYNSPIGELDTDISINQSSQIYQIDSNGLQEAKNIFSFYRKIQTRYLGEVKVKNIRPPKITQIQNKFIENQTNHNLNLFSILVLTDFSLQHQNEILLKALELSKINTIQINLAGPVKRPDILLSLKKQYSNLINNNQIRFFENPSEDQLSALCVENHIFFDTGTECDGFSICAYRGIFNRKNILSFENSGYFATESFFSNNKTVLKNNVNFLNSYFQNLKNNYFELNAFYEKKYSLYNSLPEINWEEVLL